MREQGRGAIVNVPISGKVGPIGQRRTTGRQGRHRRTDQAAARSLRTRVRVNAIQPGLIRSAMTEAMPQRIWDAKLAEVPMGRAGEPREVATVALFPRTSRRT